MASSEEEDDSLDSIDDLQTLKERYRLLRENYTDLADAYEELKKTSEKEIASRDAQLAQGLRRSSAEPNPVLTARVQSLMDEVQKLKVEKVELLSEVSSLRAALNEGRDMEGSESTQDGESTFRKARENTRLKADLAERESELVKLRAQLKRQQEYLEEVKLSVQSHNDQVAAMGIKKKKKGWFSGGSSKKKKKENQPAIIIADENLHSTDAIATTSQFDKKGVVMTIAAEDMDGTTKNSQVSTRPGEPLVSVTHLRRMQAKYKEKVDQLQKNVVILEREQARLQAETKLLDRTRRQQIEYTTNLEAANDTLKLQVKQFKISRNELEAFAGADPTAASHWKMISQIQGSLIRKQAARKIELKECLKFVVETDPDNVEAPALSNASRTLAEEHQRLHEALDHTQLKLRFVQKELKVANNTIASMSMLLADKSKNIGGNITDLVRVLSADRDLFTPQERTRLQNYQVAQTTNIPRNIQPPEFTGSECSTFRCLYCDGKAEDGDDNESSDVPADEPPPPRVDRESSPQQEPAVAVNPHDMRSSKFFYEWDGHAYALKERIERPETVNTLTRDDEQEPCPEMAKQSLRTWINAQQSRPDPPLRSSPPPTAVPERKPERKPAPEPPTPAETELRHLDTDSRLPPRQKISGVRVQTMPPEHLTSTDLRQSDDIFPPSSGRMNLPPPTTPVWVEEMHPTTPSVPNSAERSGWVKSAGDFQERASGMWVPKQSTSSRLPWSSSDRSSATLNWNN